MGLQTWSRSPAGLACGAGASALAEFQTVLEIDLVGTFNLLRLAAKPADPGDDHRARGIGWTALRMRPR